MFNATNPFNQAQDYDLNYQTWKHKQEYGYNQATALSDNSFTPTPLRTEEEKRNYMYNIGALQQMLKELKEEKQTQETGIASTLTNYGAIIGNGVAQLQNSLTHLFNNYNLMKSHNYQYLDDYYHCKANYQAAKEGYIGQKTAEIAGDIKEIADYYKNRLRGLTHQQAYEDFMHDRMINQIGINRTYNGIKYPTASEACRDFRNYNTELPQKFY